jgi:glycosyl transferase, family 25
MLSPALKAFHDEVYVLTIPSALDRQESIRRELGEGNFGLVHGVDARNVSKDEFIRSGIYDEDLARRTDRRNKSMTLGHICCSMGHRKIQESFLESGGERALIFEDDAVCFDVPEDRIAAALENIPPDADLIYWGWSGWGSRPTFGSLKQTIYHIQHSLGLLRYNHSMIANLYSRPYNKYFDRAGKQFLAHAYTVNRRAAEALVRWNTPIKLNADNALQYAVLNGDVTAYIAREQLFGQRSFNPDDPTESLTRI